MIAFDTNILVYADREDLPNHRAAKEILSGSAAGLEPIGIPVVVMVEYIRVVTHPKLFTRPTTLADGLANVSSLVNHPSFEILLPGPRFFSIFDELAKLGDARGNLVFDAQIAAICIENHVSELWTADRDFARFPGIAAKNPFQ